MKKSTKYGIVKNVSIAVACACGAGIVTCLTVGGIGGSYSENARSIAIDNGYDIANANYKTERIATYTDLYNKGLISDNEYKAEINDPKNLSYDAFITESSLCDDIKAEYFALKEKGDTMLKAFWGVLPAVVITGVSVGTVTSFGQDQKKAKNEERDTAKGMRV